MYSSIPRGFDSVSWFVLCSYAISVQLTLEIRASSTTQSELNARLEGSTPDSSFDRLISGVLSEEVEAGRNAGFLAMMHAEITASSTVREELRDQADFTNDFLRVSNTMDVGSVGEANPHERGDAKCVCKDPKEAREPHLLDSWEELIE